MYPVFGFKVSFVVLKTNTASQNRRLGIEYGSFLQRSTIVPLLFGSDAMGNQDSRRIYAGKILTGERNDFENNKDDDGHDCGRVDERGGKHIRWTN
jgi:hypothetical protein